MSVLKIKDSSKPCACKGIRTCILCEATGRTPVSLNPVRRINAVLNFSFGCIFAVFRIAYFGHFYLFLLNYVFLILLNITVLKLLFLAGHSKFLLLLVLY